jgi:drug/metabolite transporter (DMT)-like permease
MMRETLPTPKGALIILVCGCLNGLALYFYTVKAADPKIDTGVFMAIVFILMVLFTPFLSWMLTGEAITARTMFGIALAVGAIYVLCFT